MGKIEEEEQVFVLGLAVDAQVKVHGAAGFEALAKELADGWVVTGVEALDARIGNEIPLVCLILKRAPKSPTREDLTKAGAAADQIARDVKAR